MSDESHAQTLLTGLQPSGHLHIGNYFGAMRPFIEMSGNYRSFLMVVDYHALTTMRDPDTLRSHTTDVVRNYLAAGVDPARVTVFKQSDVPQHTELAWIFECLVTVPFLQQAHAYKDKVAKGLEANAGLFNYPMLMAADILLYDTDIVPVGEDQRQHIEYAREAASKFNHAYGETFHPPEERILKSVGIVPGTDGQKMSKSYKNTIPFLGSKDEIAESVMRIVTDSGAGKPEHVYAIHALFREQDELDALYSDKAGRYKELKEALIEDIEAYFAPMRERRDAITDADIAQTLAHGGDHARTHAEEKMRDVRRKIGVTS